MERPPTAAGFLVSALVHAALVAALLLSGVLPSGGCRTRQATLEIPIGFQVEPAPDSGAEPTPPQPEPEPEPPPPEPEPEPEPDVPAPPKPEQPPKKPDPPKKHEVQVSKVVVKRNNPTPTTRPPKKPVTPPGRKLTADDIRKLQETPRVGVPGGSPTGSPTAQANEDSLALARIKTTLENAWSRPVYEDRGSRPVVIRIDLHVDGSFDVSLYERSGSAVMDQSVLDAARGVRRFTFLTRDFIRRNPSVLIDFQLNSTL